MKIKYILILLLLIAIPLISSARYEEEARITDWLDGTKATIVSGTKTIQVADDPTVEFTVFEQDFSDTSVVYTVGGVVVNLEKAVTGFDAVHNSSETITFRCYEKDRNTGEWVQIDDDLTFTEGAIQGNYKLNKWVVHNDFKVTAQVSADVNVAFDLPYQYDYEAGIH